MEQGGQVGNHHGFFADPETWVSIAFIIFVLLFGRKIWQAVTAVLDKRAATVRAELEEAARLKQEAEAMLAEAIKRREAALAEARALLASAHAEAERLTASAKQDAELAARRRERMALDRIASAEKAALAEVRATAADVAAQAATEVIRRSLAGEAEAAIVDRAIAGLPAAFGRRAA